MALQSWSSKTSVLTYNTCRPAVWVRIDYNRALPLSPVCMDTFWHFLGSTHMGFIPLSCYIINQSCHKVALGYSIVSRGLTGLMSSVGMLFSKDMSIL